MKKKNISQKKILKGSSYNNSHKNLRKKIDILYNNDIQKGTKIKNIIEKLCSDDNQDDDQDNSIEKYRGLNIDRKNKQVLLELANNLGINSDKLRHKSDNEICQKLIHTSIPGSKLYHPNYYYKKFIDNKKYLKEDTLRPGVFIRNVKKKVESLLIENKLIYNSIFKNQNYISLYEKSVYLSQGNRVLSQMEELLLEVSAVLENNGSTYWQDFFSSHPRVKSTTFFSSLTSRDRDQLEKIYQVLVDDINQTKKYLIDLDNQKEVRDQIKDIETSKIKRRQLEIKENQESRNIRKHQWDREDKYDKYEDRYGKNAKYFKAADVASEISKINPVIENVGKEALKNVSSLVNIGRSILRI